MQPLLSKPSVHFVDDGNLLTRPRHKDDPVSLKTLVLPSGKLSLYHPVLVDQDSAQAKPCRSSLAKSKLDKPALTGKNLGREFPAVLAGHRPFDPLNDGGDRRTIVFELFCAVGYLDASTPADILVVSAFVSVLKTPPTTDVVDQDDLKICLAGLDVLDKLLKTWTSTDF
ncbi:hypothetical protein SDC9_143091 [bioreactor metagenome]|uniref:Uncharacterized protein n=1 Tax=bioreactor metagenome TaxID=1076179 RepID=A0A645E325_9ZZZZ